ncbi:pyridoxamine 5'-phosphate oxidase family protein [Noviherbaspirillum sp. ST9]|uniref:pyridoxamine 5'-phosphate oxidase family protein n=1 Tax=Noviherbaspirillum sp. ST9 TaxID=3401606 RepID=UPI003B586E5D
MNEAANRAAPFHPGEQAAQVRAGVRAQMEKVGAVVLRDFMPEQHREFFPLLPTLFAGAEDENGRLWASVLTGPPGFVSSPAQAALRVDALPAKDDPLASALQPGKAIGLLGLQFETRRRNRANGTVASLDARGFDFALAQSFGNCAKYIQTRELDDSPAAQPKPVTHGGALLPDAATALIGRADTFFIATGTGVENSPAHGADVSHRGGRPGFVHIDESGMLAWPDFQGNNFFNTIGNLAADGRAGLLFIDFARGDLLHLSGTAGTDWDGPDVARLAGAKRVMRFQTQHHVFRPGALPMRWRLKEASPHLEGTGTWG